MIYEKIEPARGKSLEPLPENDTLFRLDDGSHVRLRITAMTTEGSVRNQSPEPGVNETINLKFQCSLADESGDVREDAPRDEEEPDKRVGNYLILAAEVHSVTADALLNSGQSFEAWVTDRVDEMLVKAQRKAYILDQVLAKYRIPAEPDPDSPIPKTKARDQLPKAV